MVFPFKSLSSFFKRSATLLFAYAGLFCVCLPSVNAQERLTGEKRSRFMDRIDPEEGARRLEAFRSQRLKGDYFFEFELEHRPSKSSRKLRYQGQMWGTWNADGPLTRFVIYPDIKDEDVSVAAFAPVDLIVQNGPEAGVWRRDASGDFALVEGDAIFEAVIAGLIYSPFDLQMPFIYWNSYIYEGPSLVGASRVGQRFLMQPPVGSASLASGISGVRISLDDNYNALWRVEVLGSNQLVRSRFSVKSFKKLQEQYIVKRITLTEYPSKDSTSFEVKAASLNLSLAQDLFDPELSVSVDNYIPEVIERL